MTKRDDIPKTDPSEIEALIQRLKQSYLEPRDVQLVEHNCDHIRQIKRVREM